MDGTRGYYAKRNKLITERQVPCDLTDTWNLRNKTEDHRGREEKHKTRQNQRETNHKRLLIIGNKLNIAGREVGWSMG